LSGTLPRIPRGKRETHTRTRLVVDVVAATWATPSGTRGCENDSFTALESRTQRLRFGHVCGDELQHAAFTSREVRDEGLNVCAPLIRVATAGPHIASALEQLPHAKHAGDGACAEDAVPFRRAAHSQAGLRNGEAPQCGSFWCGEVKIGTEGALRTMPAVSTAIIDAVTSPARVDGDIDAADAGLHCSLPFAGDAFPGTAVACLRTHGAVVLRNCLTEDVVAAAACALQPFLDAVTSGWAAEADTLALPSWRQWGVTRTPRVNAGKKNVHFAPERVLEHSGEPSLHSALEQLARAGRFSDVLSAYFSDACVDLRDGAVCLTETGVSITRPGGAGMELHADGGVGEATVLLSLACVPQEVGGLALVPGSHSAYSTDATQEAQEQDDTLLPGQQARRRALTWHCYRPGDALVIDARTLHGASDNTSESAWRCVAWFIFNYVQETQP